MKNILTIIALIICFVSNQAIGQSVDLESTIKSDKTGTLLSVQRIEVTSPIFTLKYDYKSSGDDVLGIIFPKIYSNATSSLSGMIVKNGDGNSNDQFIFDVWGNKKFGKFSTTIDFGHIVSRVSKPHYFIGTRLSYGNFTAEGYIVSQHPINQKLEKTDHYYTWIAYHTNYTFTAFGKEDKQYWGFAGTKGLKHFGNFTLVNYQPETNNFWFKSQTGFGEINQKFFCQENYIIATSYFTVPLFYYLHFSPLVTKGTLAIKVEGRRTAGISNYEAMLGKQLGNNLLGYAAGINSEYNQNNLNLAPSFELYKTWKNSLGQCIVELRYDQVYKACSAYLVVKY